MTSARPSQEPRLPPGRFVAVPERGRMWVWESPGPPGAPVLVLLHGWTATAALNWFTSFEALGRHFRVLAPDLRGHGRGIASSWPFRLEQCASDIAGLAEALDIERLTAVGYSMGGPVAQLLWRRHPEVVEGLVLCATAARFPVKRTGDWLFQPTMSGLSVVAVAIPPCLRRRAMGPLLARRDVSRAHGPWAVSEWMRSDPIALGQAGLTLEHFDSTGWSPSIDVPTVVLVTSEDTRVPPNRQRALAEAIPGARDIEVPAGHMACVAEPQLFVPALVDACLDVTRRAGHDIDSEVEQISSA